MLKFLKKKMDATGDVLILISENEIRQYSVENETEESVNAGGMTFPRIDAHVRYYPEGGRAFIYGYTPTYLTETENIANLERNTVLRNLFDYGVVNKFTNLQFYVMIAALVIIVLLLRN